MKLATLILGLVLLTGCEPAMVKPETDVSVGIVDGKELRRIAVSDTGIGTHFVYYFPIDKRQPISNNMRVGKISTVIVLVDGRPVSTNSMILEKP
jgi:hypothetical protein